MTKIQTNSQKTILIGEYRVLDVFLSNDEKDIFHVLDLSNKNTEYTLRILKSNQNPKQIDNELEILTLLNSYEETQTFRKLEIFSDKLLFVFEYINGKNLKDIYDNNHNFFNEYNIKKFLKSIMNILKIYKENHILHNNITQENILFDGENYYLIGLSRASIVRNINQTVDYCGLISVVYFLLTGKEYDIEYELPQNINTELLSIIEKKENIQESEIMSYISKL